MKLKEFQEKIEKLLNAERSEQQYDAKFIDSLRQIVRDAESAKNNLLVTAYDIPSYLNKYVLAYQVEKGIRILVVEDGMLFICEPEETVSFND